MPLDVQTPSLRSRLGESLRRLQRSIQGARETEALTSEQFARWQERWAEQRHQISQRLALIDAQLKRFVVKPNEVETTPFSVVGNETVSNETIGLQFSGTRHPETIRAK